MKKIILGLGSAAAVVAPITTVISCKDKKTTHEAATTKVTNNGIAVPAEVNVTSTEPAYDGATWSFTVPAYEAPGAKLQYQVNDGTWSDLLPAGETKENIADGATIKFQWVLIDDSTSWSGTPTPPAPIHHDSTATGIATPVNPTVTSNLPTHNGADWSFKVSAYNTPGAMLQYSTDNNVNWNTVSETEVNVPYGKTVTFQWALTNANSVWVAGQAPAAPTSIVGTSQNTGVTPPASNPVITHTDPAYNGATWTFTVPAYTLDGAKLQYQIDSGDLKDVTTSAVTVAYGKTVHFQWTLDAGHAWIGDAPSAPADLAPTSTTTGVTPPASNPVITHTNPAYDGATWTFTVPAYTLDGAKLQYQIDADGAWTDVPTTAVTVAYGKTVHFQWTLDAGHAWIGDAPSAPADLAPTSTITGVAAPSAPTITHTDPAYINADWTFTVTSAAPTTGAKLQYQIDGGSWTDATSSAVTVPYGKTVHFKWVLDANHVWTGTAPTIENLIAPISTQKLHSDAFEAALKTSVAGVSMQDLYDSIGHLQGSIGSKSNIISSELDNLKTSLGIPSSHVISNILKTQAAIIKDRKVIGILKDDGFDFHGMTRVMFLLDGAKATSDTAKQWGGNTLPVVYGKDLAQATTFEDGRTSTDVGAYVSFVIKTDSHQVVRVSTGQLIDGTTQDFANSNDIWFFKTITAVSSTTPLNLQSDVLDRQIYGSVAWNSADGHNMINPSLGGHDITGDQSLYSSTEYDGLYVLSADLI